jgi:hypothetical protein
MIWHCRNATDRRRATLEQAAMLLLDILAVPCSFVLIVGGFYRFRNVWDQRAAFFMPFHHAQSGQRFRHYPVIFLQTAHLFIDLPCNLAGLIACASLYRGYLLYVDLKVTPRPALQLRRGEHRLLCLYHCGMIVPDVVCAMLAVPVVATIWRIPTLKANHQRGKRFHFNVCALLRFASFDCCLVFSSCRVLTCDV